MMGLANTHLLLLLSFLTVYRGKVMRKISVEIVGIGALKLTGFLKELMQKRSMTYESLYTVWTHQRGLHTACSVNFEIHLYPNSLFPKKIIIINSKN
jgi:hypothetical protein